MEKKWEREQARKKSRSTSASKVSGSSTGPSILELTQPTMSAERHEPPPSPAAITQPMSAEHREPPPLPAIITQPPAFVPQVPSQLQTIHAPPGVVYPYPVTTFPPSLFFPQDIQPRRLVDHSISTFAHYPPPHEFEFARSAYLVPSTSYTQPPAHYAALPEQPYPNTGEPW
jgi:hypothetical protein